MQARGHSIRYVISRRVLDHCANRRCTVLTSPPLSLHTIFPSFSPASLTSSHIIHLPARLLGLTSELSYRLTQVHRRRLVGIGAAVIDLAQAGSVGGSVDFTLGISTDIDWDASTDGRYDDEIVAYSSDGVPKVLAYLPATCAERGTVAVALTDEDSDVVAIAIRDGATGDDLSPRVAVHVISNHVADVLEDVLGCFPGAALVAMADGRSKPMSALHIGDVTAMGVVTNWIHRDTRREPRGVYVRIETASGASLTVTKNHLVKVDGAFTFAGSVRPEQRVELASGAESAVVAVIAVGSDTRDVVAVDGTVHSRAPVGFYAPLTASGELFVDGIRASCYAAVPCASHRLAQVLFAPMHYALGGTYLETVTPAEEDGLHWYPTALRAAWGATKSLIGDVCDDQSSTATD